MSACFHLLSRNDAPKTDDKSCGYDCLKLLNNNIMTYDKFKSLHNQDGNYSALQLHQFAVKYL